MSDSKKKRLSMLDNLASAAPPAPSSMMQTNRPLRAARDAVDAHKVWDLLPSQIIDDRVTDRLDLSDIADLRDSIEATGQSVPILVRRHPSEKDKYVLVYGRRRLEAIRSSDTLTTVRALIANMDDESAVEAQISENMGRRDLTYIEKALFAHELIESGFGKQQRVAEVLTVTKSSISMGLAIVQMIGPDLIRAIGPAVGVGRPRWDAMARAMETTQIQQQALQELAHQTRGRAEVAPPSDAAVDPSVAAFDAVLAQLEQSAPRQTVAKPQVKGPKPKALRAGGKPAGKLSRTASGIRLDLGQGGFADWVEDQAQDLIDDLYARYTAADDTTR